MAELLTTKELQAILQVDRTTIYRMADSGRLPAFKVGNQWRFRSDQIEAWLQNQEHGALAPPADPGQSTRSTVDDVANLFPLECIQLIQDGFADALGVMILVTDLNGNMITQPSNACGLFTAAADSPSAHKRCLELWVRLANEPSLAPRFLRSHLGLLCARGLIRVGSKIKAMVVLGGIAPTHWPPEYAELQRIAGDLGLDPDLLDEYKDQVHRLDSVQQANALPYAQRIADIFAHVASERHEFSSRLRRIAEITNL